MIINNNSVRPVSFKVIDLMSLTIACPLFNIAFNIFLISSIVSELLHLEGMLLVFISIAAENGLFSLRKLRLSCTEFGLTDSK